MHLATPVLSDDGITIDHYDIRSFSGSLRKLWLHLGFHATPFQAIAFTSWLLSECRLATSEPSKRYIISFEPRIWLGLHHVQQTNDITSKEAIWDLSPSEVISMKVISVDGCIGQLFDLLSWSRGIIWDYRQPIFLERAIAHINGGIFRSSIRDAVQHAGSHLTASDSDLSPSLQQALIDYCHNYRVTIKPPQRAAHHFRGHRDHSTMILQWSRENSSAGINVQRPGNESIAVPIRHLHLDVPMEDDMASTPRDEPSAAVAASST